MSNPDRDALRPVVVVALSTALAGLLMGLLGAWIAVSTDDVTVGVLIRGLLTLVLVMLICRAVTQRAKRAGVAHLERTILAGALLGFLLDPLTWVARTALTQAVVDPGPLTLIGDLVLWLLAAGLGTLWGSRNVAGPAPTVTPYG